MPRDRAPVANLPTHALPMKRTSAVLLGFSLLANAALLTAVLRRAPGTPAAEGTPSPGGAQPAVPPAVTPPVPPVAPPEPPAKLWERLRSDDARQLAARLREAGMPDSAARLLVADTLRAHYLARQAELIGSTAPAEFWKSAAAAADREKQATLRKLARAQQDLLVELYGPGETAAADRERQRRLYGLLPDEKLERVDRIHADYGDMADDIRAQAGGLLLATDRETLALLEQERRKDVAAILTPEELELYDLQTSATARALRARLAAFAPTEKEFRALFALQRSFDDRLGGATGPAGTDRATAEAELAKQVKAALGEARYEEYRRQQDPGYRVAARIAERFGLPVKRAAEVCALAQSTQARLQGDARRPGARSRGGAPRVGGAQPRRWRETGGAARRRWRGSLQADLLRRVVARAGTRRGGTCGPGVRDGCRLARHGGGNGGRRKDRAGGSGRRHCGGRRSEERRCDGRRARTAQLSGAAGVGERIRRSGRVPGRVGLHPMAAASAAV
jgi:hypothetical protein